MGLKEKSKSSKVKIFAIGRSILTFPMVFKWWIYRSTCFFCNLDQPNATVRSRVGNPKGIHKTQSLSSFYKNAWFFFFLNKNFIYHFIGIHFHNSKNCVKKNYTSFIVRKSDKNNCMYFFFRVFESHWFVSSGKKK